MCKYLYIYTEVIIFKILMDVPYSSKFLAVTVPLISLRFLHIAMDPGVTPLQYLVLYRKSWDMPFPSGQLI
jgi:hypothetical protein